jgi:acetate kinase
MQTILEHAGEDPRARRAIDLFCYRAKHYLGAYAAILGGVDLLVFTGGIGEHSPEIRQAICSDLEFLGIKLDRRANEKSAEIISTVSSKARIRIVPTDEDFVIAAEARKLLSRVKPAPS